MTQIFSRAARQTRWLSSAAAGALVLAAGAAAAQDAPIPTAQPEGPPAPEAAAATNPSDILAVNLTRLLVQQGVISQQAADDLIRQAEAQTAQARAQQAALAPPPAGTLRVPYVPEVVRNQIRDEVKAEVLATAERESWAAPNQIPSWTRRITWSGDIRLRSQYELYDDGNTPEYIDYASFNDDGPTDANLNTNLEGFPILNASEDRLNRLLVRARLGMTAKVTDEVTVGVRLATGSSDSPVSTNQVLGGGFSKKDIWLDRAYVKIQPWSFASVTLGRMANPFFSTDLMYDDDLNFDGVSAAGRYSLYADESFNVTATAGLFPLDYTGTNFPDNQLDKAESRDKYLYALQVGADYASEPVKLRAAAAYYDFDKVRGRLSQPCFVSFGEAQCSSDLDRPAFMQKGNTLFLLRNIAADPSNENFELPQFAGLAFEYRVLDLTAEASFPMGDQELVVTGSYVRNLAYDEDKLCRYAPFGQPVNNVRPGLGQDDTDDNIDNPALNFDICAPTPEGFTDSRFESGPNGWMARALFGRSNVSRQGEWAVFAGYKYLEPDAVLDGFTDSDFHLGGTNAEGYFIGGDLALYQNTVLRMRWLSANEVYGAPLSIDVGQVDLNIRF